MRRQIAGLLILACLGGAAAGASDNTDVETDRRAQFHSVVPAFGHNVVLGRPTDHSAVVNVFVQHSLKLEIRYGSGRKLELTTGAKSIAAGSTHEFVLDNLPADSAVSYQLFDANSGQPLNSAYSSGTFHSARPRGETFIFTIQADSHLDGDTIPSLYAQTLENVSDARPDFHIDLGDTFMTDKIDDFPEAERQYTAQRYYFGRLCHSVPLFMVLGNHDGIAKARLGKKKNAALTDWSIRQRASYFSTPQPDQFYEANPGAGQFHYSWHWGDALFVVLDPYSHSDPTRSGREPWNMTLGNKQYEWLVGVLRASDARFKFIFIHQLVSGMGQGGRGGREAASLFEWGGHDETGVWRFEEFRPGWEQPIHSLLRETGVSAVFHGHDHFFAHQSLEGINYILVPQPAHRNSRKHHAEEYGYESGMFISNSGHVQVEVSSEKAVVSYVRSANDELKKPVFRNGEVAYSYEIHSR